MKLKKILTLSLIMCIVCIFGCTASSGGPLDGVAPGMTKAEVSKALSGRKGFENPEEKTYDEMERKMMSMQAGGHAASELAFRGTDAPLLELGGVPIGEVGYVFDEQDNLLMIWLNAETPSGDASPEQGKEQQIALTKYLTEKYGEPEKVNANSEITLADAFWQLEDGSTAYCAVSQTGMVSVMVVGARE